MGNTRATIVYAVLYLCRHPVVLRSTCVCEPDGAQWDVEYGLYYLGFIMSKGAQ